MDPTVAEAVKESMWISTMNVSMLDQIAVGGATSLVNLIIHAVLVGAIAATLRNLANTDASFPGFVQYTLVIVATGTLLVIGHFVECVIWAYVYKWVDAAPANTDLIYFAFGNYTTLGYGDVVPKPEWHMLGPLTALNGVMLIGWSTALVYDLLHRSVQTPRPS